MMIIDSLQYIVFAILAFNVTYLFVFAVTARLYREKKNGSSVPEIYFSVMLPAYREDAVILESAADACVQNYPRHLFEVLVIADSLQPDTLAALKKMPLKTVEVSFENSTKARAIEAGLQATCNEATAIVILDADNMMEPDFLLKMQRPLLQGALAVQGHRTAKNMDTDMARLDAASEEINNTIFRKGHRVLGLSAALIGSGMAFERNFFIRHMKQVKAVGGFDKELELGILKEGIQIEYVEQALVYDEKVRKNQVFESQRRRWLAAQLHYFRKHAFSGIVHLVKHNNLDYFDKVVQMMLLPRILLLASTCGLSALSLLVPLKPAPAEWHTLAVICCLSVLLALPGSFFNWRIFKSLLRLPGALFSLLLAILKLKGSNQKFIHTPHSN